MSPPLEGGNNILGENLSQKFNTALRHSGFDHIRWGRLRRKLAYAHQWTDVEIEDGDGRWHDDGSVVVEETGEVSVRVTYPFYLNIPIANRLLGKKYTEHPQYDSRELPSPGSYYRPIRATMTLLNEGEENFPEGS